MTPIAIKSADADARPTVVYKCEGCGTSVFFYGVNEAPTHGFCCQCSFLSDFFPDREEMMKVYRHLNEIRTVAG